MQVLLLQYLGWILLVIGITLVFAAIISAKRDVDGNQTGTQSKGVILLGVIPIVWGYGRKGWMITGVIGIILCLVWILLSL